MHVNGCASAISPYYILVYLAKCATAMGAIS